jgi:hypothetical protein
MTAAEHESVEAFVGRYPRFADPIRSASQCRIASETLIQDAPELQGELVWVRGHRVPVVPADDRANLADAHALVRLPTGEFVDVTRRQYDSGADAITVYADETALGAHWHEFSDDAPWPETWRSLQAA